MAQFPFFCKVEMVFLLYSFGCALPQPGTFAVLRTKACTYHMNLGQDTCDRLPKLPEQRYQVNRLAGIVALTSEAILTLLSAFVAILVGPCCDKYGFKDPLLAATVGAGLTTACNVLAALLAQDKSMAYNVIAVLPQGLSGGLVLARACCYYIISKETSIRFVRSLRFFVLDMVGMLGKFGGLVLGWLLNQAFGYLPSLGAAGVLQAVVLVLLLTEDELEKAVSSPDGALKKLAAIFTMANAKQAFNIVNVGRGTDVADALRRLLTLLAIISVMNMGPEEIMQPFTRIAYGWSLRTYSWVSGVGNVAVALGGIMVVLCFKMLCATEVQLIFLGVIFAMFRNAVIGLAGVPVAFFFSYLLAMPQGAGPAGIKSYFSRLAPDDETGKVLIFVTSCESVVGVAARVVFASVFSLTLVIHKGLLFFIAAALGLPAITLTRAVAKLTPATETEIRPTQASAPASKIGVPAPGALATAAAPHVGGVRLPALDILRQAAPAVARLPISNIAPYRLPAIAADNAHVPTRAPKPRNPIPH